MTAEKLEDRSLELVCGVPHRHETIQLAHGGGGSLMQELLDHVFLPAFKNPWLDQKTDAATVPTLGGRPVITTDSYVIHPLRFPGGDIGKLAVCGTLNDLGMALARPRYLAASFIIEEGFSIACLKEIVSSMAASASQANVTVITGDTKVVDRGRGHQLFINTTGLGESLSEETPMPSKICAGDHIILSGDLGRHSMAVLSCRDGVGFETDLESDCENLFPMVEALHREGILLRCLRDVTRGGLSAALNELCRARGLRISVTEGSIPIDPRVREAAEFLGLDPLHCASEGRFIAAIPAEHSARAVEVLRQFPAGTQACQIGVVEPVQSASVLILTRLGLARRLDMLSGEGLPRIC